MAITETAQLVIDADAHVIETERTWDYLEPGEGRFRPQIVESTSDPDTRYWLINGKIAGLRTVAASDASFAQTSKRARRNVAVDARARKMEDIDLRLAHMEELGIDVQVLHNSLWIERVTDRPDVEVALCRSWNRWLADIWAEGRGKLRWTCVVPTLDLEAAKDELSFARAHGAVGLCMQPYAGELMMLDPYFHPLYAHCEQLDLAVIVHIANGNPALVDILRTRYEGSGGFAAFRVPTMLACFELLRSGLPARWPKLRWGFVETSAQWVPWLLHEIARRTGQTFSAEENPFVAQNVYVTTQTDDDHAYLVEQMGSDRLVIGTDYGHGDTSSELDAIARFRRLELPDELRHRVLVTNPARLYGL